LRDAVNRSTTNGYRLSQFRPVLIDIDSHTQFMNICGTRKAPASRRMPLS
jgi:hypothetical protein